MNTRHLALLIVATGMAACQTTQTTQRDATLPATATVQAPAESVPADYAAFSGTWSGEWGSCLPGKLAVTEVEPSGAVETIYSWGDCAEWDITAGNARHRGQIEDNILRLERFPNGAQVEYVLQPDGSLAGTYERNGNITIGTFQKV